jgi:lysophospholipase L1-like esterase
MKKLLLLLPIIAVMLYSFQSPKRTIFMVGDSTMANKQATNFPETGWGQALPYFADSTKITIDNHARNGRSTKSFIDEGLWKKVEDKIKPGDYVFIQFGHNDEKKDKPNVYARAETSYKTNLTKMVDATRAKGGIPVLFTSIVRRDFAPNGKLNDTHGTYIEAVKQLATELNVTLVDLEAATHLLVEKMGPEASCALYLHFKEGEYPNFGKGAADNTHLSRYGAIQVASLAVNAIKSQIPDLAVCF